MSFKDKVVIVTGSSSGIGAAIAIKFSEEGAKVTLVGRNTEKLNNVAKKCNNPLVVAADLNKDENVKRIIDETLKKFGKLDILVNNAGMSRPATIQAENAMKAFDEVMSTNVRSVVYLTHLAAPHLVKTKGNIINISSVAAFKVVTPATFAYNTSKAALDHFTRSIAQELASSGVRVNVVNPGPVRTDFVENMGLAGPAVDGLYDEVKNMTALNRVSDPEEIADLVLFLASDKARAITGSSFVSDNGIVLKVPESNSISSALE